MKTVMVTSLMAACALALACNTHDKNEPVDTTRTTSAVVVEPTLHDGHAAEPNGGITPMTPNSADQNDNVDRENQSGVDQNNVDQNVDQNIDRDVDQDMSGPRDASVR